MHTFIRISQLCAAAALALASNTALATVEPVKVADNVYVFKGPLANCTALVTDDGTLLVDSGETPRFGMAIYASLKTLSDKPTRYLVNTHCHFDHVTGNATFAYSGTKIVAQENTLGYLVKESGFPHDALPATTFKTVTSLLLGGEEIIVFHPETGGAHTGGDAVVYLRKANVLATGDLMFNGMYPSIDSAVGGWAKGMAQSCREAAAMIDDKTVVIPGHGVITDKKGLLQYAQMLGDVADKVQGMMDKGMSLDEIVAAHPTKGWDQMCSHSTMPPPYKVSGDFFVKFVYWSLQAHAHTAN